jgi:hypothetical protein
MKHQLIHNGKAIAICDSYDEAVKAKNKDVAKRMSEWLVDNGNTDVFDVNNEWEIKPVKTDPDKWLVIAFAIGLAVLWLLCWWISKK